MNKIFIVGAPRSGTTLLQQLIVANFSIISLPETHFFSRTYTKNKIKTIFLNERLRAYFEFKRIEKMIGFKGGFEKKLFSHKKIIDSFSDGLTNYATLSGDYQGWLEKTPLHLHYLTEINKLNDVKVIHLVRRGEDVASSLYKATNEFPKKWVNKRFTTFKGFSAQYCVDRWNEDVSISEKYAKIDNHHIVFYEDILNYKDAVLDSLSEFLMLDREQEKGIDEVASKLINENETWKANNFSNEIKVKKTRDISPYTINNEVLSQINSDCYEVLHEQYGIK